MESQATAQTKLFYLQSPPKVSMNGRHRAPCTAGGGKQGGTPSTVRSGESWLLEASLMSTVASQTSYRIRRPSPVLQLLLRDEN